MPAPTKKPTNQNWYTIRAAQGGDTAEVLIYGDIGESWFGESVTAQQFVKDLQALADKQLTVRINSYGGSVSDGVAIYNAIKRHPQPKNVEIDGVAVSIASLIAMAGDIVKMAENALLMVHAPWGAAVGNSTDLRNYADLLDKYAEAMATSYSAKTRQSAEAMYELLSDGADHWYPAQEAKDAGFVDVVTPSAQDEESARYQRAALARFKVPAAAAARFAAVAAQLTPNKETVMPEAKDPAAEKKPENTNVIELEEAAKAKQRAALKNRNADIKTAFAKFMDRAGVAQLYAACIEDPEMSAEQANAKLLQTLAENAEPAARAAAGEDARDKTRAAMTASLAVRMGHAKDDSANPYRGMRMHELARACLRATGMKVDGLSVMDIASMALTRQPPRGAQTTSDFPVILENTMHKLLLQGFSNQPVTWPKFCRVGDVSDFRLWNRLVPGLLGNLDVVNEHGEYVEKMIPDAQKNSVQAVRRGNLINITPEIIINDDTGYIQMMAAGLGATGQRAIERAVYALLNSNPVLSDGIALFHANHNNLAAAGTVPGVDVIDAGRQAMAAQTAPGTDAEYLDIRPEVGLATLAQGGNFRVIINALYDPDTANKLQKPNKVNGLVNDVVDSPRLTGTAWYLFANPSIAPVFEVVFLDGQRAPLLTEEIKFKSSGLAWKVELPFGVGVIDFRGGYKNPGA